MAKRKNPVSKGLEVFEPDTSWMKHPHAPRNYRKADKATGNSYNRGEMEFEELKDPQIDPRYKRIYLGTGYNLQDNETIRELTDILQRLFVDSPWGITYGLTKKIPKNELGNVYTFFRTNVDMQWYSSVDIFSATCEYLDIKENNLYDVIGPVYKEELLRELDGKYGMLKKSKTKKLF